MLYVVLLTYTAISAVVVYLLRFAWGTTLQAPFAWTLVALSVNTTLAATETLSGSTSVPETAYLYAFAASCCPCIAVLGAKRPQNTAWQFVVVTLWAVLAQPGLEAWVYGRPLSGLHNVRVFACCVILALTGLNWLGTRFWISVGLGILGQLLLLWRFMPVFESDFLPHHAAQLALACWTLAAILVALRFPRPRGPAITWNTVWRDWRDLYGNLWAFRVMERMNATAEASDWSQRLQWSGFGSGDAGPQSSELSQIDVALQGMLRRFLNEAWYPNSAARTDIST